MIPSLRISIRWLKMATIKDGKLHIDLDDIKSMFASASSEERDDLARSLCMDAFLFSGAYDAMANGYWGDMWEGGWSFDSRVVNRWREKFLPLAPKIMRDLVYGLLRERKQISQQLGYYQRLASWLEHGQFQLERGIPRPRPVDPGFAVNIEIEEVDDFIDRLLQLGATEGKPDAGA